MQHGYACEQHTSALRLVASAVIAEITFACERRHVVVIGQIDTCRMLVTIMVACTCAVVHASVCAHLPLTH
jgi:hypothetical protein